MLVSVGKDKEAEGVLNKIFEKNATQQKLTEIKEVIGKSKQEGSILKSLSHRHYLIPMLIVFAIAILAQMTGINSILQFSATILKESGLGSNYVTILGGVTITAINFLATLIAVLYSR